MISIGFPGLNKSQGPKIFLSRLRDSINKQGLAKTRSFKLPFYDIALFSSVAHQTYRKPYVIRIDGIYFDRAETCGSNTDLNSPIFNAIRGASGVIFQSEFNRRLVDRYFGNINVPCCVIQNGVPLFEFSPNGPDMRSRLGLSGKAELILTSAAWRSHKRLSSVIDVFLLLVGKRADLHLVIMGGGVPEGERVVHPNIHYAGHIEPHDLPAWYRTGDVFLFLSWLDHCPNTVVEAVASGLPVVCSNQGGTREIIEHSHGGIIAPADTDYDLELVDLYTPRKPNINIVATEVVRALDNMSVYRSNINYSAVDIDQSARQYVRFLEDCLH